MDAFQIEKGNEFDVTPLLFHRDYKYVIEGNFPNVSPSF